MGISGKRAAFDADRFRPELAPEDSAVNCINRRHDPDRWGLSPSAPKSAENTLRGYGRGNRNDNQHGRNRKKRRRRPGPHNLSLAVALPDRNGNDIHNRPPRRKQDCLATLRAKQAPGLLIPKPTENVFDSIHCAFYFIHLLLISSNSPRPCIDSKSQRIETLFH